MASSSDYDYNARDLPSANEFVIKSMVQYVERDCKGDIPPAAIKYITDKLRTLSPMCNFHKNIASGVVQVDVNFQGTINGGTSLFKDGYTWKIRCTIDADIPPSSSSQRKHVGFEIHFKTKSKVAGHAWCDDVSKGRSATGVRMHESTSEAVTDTFKNNDTVTYSITTHTL